MCGRQLDSLHRVRLADNQARLVLIALAWHSTNYECEVNLTIRKLKEMTELPANLIRHYVKQLAKIGLFNLVSVSPNIRGRVTLPGVPWIDQTSGKEVPWSDEFTLTWE